MWQGREGRLLAVATAAYLTATGAGVVMRLQLAGLDTGIPFPHLLHAHSHTLFFGWAGLAALVLIAAHLPGDRPRVEPAAWLLAGSAPALFAGFLWLGYHPVTIGVSTVAMLAWYLAVAVLWRRLKGWRGTGPLAVRLALSYLVGSSLGVWALGAIRASGVKAPLAERLSVHAFLIGYGWFLVFAVVALILVEADRLGLALDRAAARRALMGWAPLAWATFPLAVGEGAELAWVGPLARGAGLLLLVPAWIWSTALWRAAPPGRGGALWRGVAAWFALSALGPALVGALGSSALLSVGRQGLVIHLHALFVGFVTTALALVAARSAPVGPLRLHHAALASMMAGLAAVSMGWTEVGTWWAAVSSVILWVAGWRWAGSIVGPPAMERSG